MKPLLTGLGLTLSIASIQAQSFGIPWSSTHAGGGATGGPFRVNVSVGQTAASPPMSGGGFAVLGGYWSGEFLRPELRVTPTGANVVISWPHSATRFRLQSASALLGAATIWTDVTATPVTVANEDQVTLSVVGDRRFFRLRRP